MSSHALFLVKKTVKHFNGVSLGERCAWRFFERVAEGNNNMIHPTKLMRGAVSAIAILGAAPMVAGVPVLGVVTA
ncbi:hypothetical protein, partial [Devosia indica]